MPKPPRPAALRYRAKPALIATAYVIVLVVPWILTCVLSSRTVRQSWDNSGAIERETAGNLHRVSFLIDALNLIAAVAALPVIYALLARAAVVLSQRTNHRKTLNVKQLMALADRNFVRDGLAGNLGAKSFLFLLGVALVPLDIPRDLVVEKTRNALIDAFPTEWMATAWYDPDADQHEKRADAGRYFASSLPPDTTTGLYKQHALRMNSSAMCNDIPASEVPARCPGTYDRVFYTSYDNANLTVNICLQAPEGRSGPWNYTEDRQELTETLYITVSSPWPSRGWTSYANGTLRCIGKTSMGYFELGNSFNGGKFGPLLSSFNFLPGTGNSEFSDDVRKAVYPSIGLFNPTYRGGEFVHDYGNSRDGYIGAYGPLMLATHAMFGAGSFFELAQSIREPNDTLSQALCQLSPIPFSRTDLHLSRCDPQDTRSGPFSSTRRGRFASRYGWANDRVGALISGIRESNGTVTGILNTAMYLANKATLDVAAGSAVVSPRGTWDPRQIWRADGIEIRTPVVSTAGLVVVTVLLGFQVVGIVALLWYIYSVPTWTATLDAMAVAKITRQLAERNEGFLRSDALSKPTAEEIRQMEDMDALVGLVEHETPEKPGGSATTTNVSSGEATPLAPASSEHVGHVLSVGALGLISRGMMKKVSKSSV
ncbi:hypothetical protein F5144DRAFT_492685 [Chaetomium tenue]|uniref:Uncharacterized protein n=1 Tax=Chaetomium tenue TaxID=1854479 RepID=A0ACB7P4M5_9PEZI|nr:hypothetical protein F5144DRAFT_492685 [Chaetomium globosum]